MKTKGLIAAALALALSGNWAFAQPGDEVQPGEQADAGDLGVTITVMPEGADQSDVVTGEITLPMDEDGNYIPADEGVENSADGLRIANEARANGREFGEAAAAAAEGNREDLGRGSIPNLEDLIPGDLVPEDLIPDQMPETPDDLPVDLPDVP